MVTALILVVRHSMRTSLSNALFRFYWLTLFSSHGFLFFYSVNSTLSIQDVLINTPADTLAHDHAAFAPHGSHTMLPQIAVLKSKSRIEEHPHKHPHKHTRGWSNFLKSPSSVKRMDTWAFSSSFLVDVEFSIELQTAIILCSDLQM